MKVYLSVDIEGVAGIASPEEADLGRAESVPFRHEMTDEAAAACEGAFAGGAKSVLLKDAHGSGRNIDPRRLSTPDGKSLQLIRGWSGHPFAMVQGIDSSFAMAAFIGFHSAAGSGGNPLAHTVSGRAFSRVELNGEPASEFLLYGLAAASAGVPVGFLSGDRALCEDAKRRIDGVTTVSIFEGVGASVQSILPDEAVRRVRDGVCRALTLHATSPIRPMAMPADFDFRLTFVRSSEAYAKSFYPGAKLVADHVVSLESKNLIDVLTFLRFAKA